LNEVIGRDKVERYGARVELIATIGKQSSSQMIREIATRYRLANETSK